MLEYFSEAQEQRDGKNTVPIFEEGMKQMLKDALNKHDFDEDAIILAKAAKIVREDIFSHGVFKFSGSFLAVCQANSLLSSLKYLMSMMMINSPTPKDQPKHDSQACLTIGQTTVYNTKKTKSTSTTTSRHKLERKPKLPIYIDLSEHSLTGSKKLVQHLYKMCIIISSDRILQLEGWIAT